MAELLQLRNEEGVGDVDEKCTKEMEKGNFQNCSRMFIDETQGRVFCNACINPSQKWRIGDCNLADSFLKSDYVTEKKKVRVGQQKGRKKKNR
jgi:hypothetical protein